jgi:hypothetical protein
MMNVEGRKKAMENKRRSQFARDGKKRSGSL